MGFETSSTSIESGETIDFSLSIGGAEISAPTIIIELPAGLSFAKYDANNNALPIERPNTQTVAWYPLIAEVATNYEYPAVIDVSVIADNTRQAIQKSSSYSKAFVVEASAYIDGELIAVSQLILDSPEKVTPTNMPQPTHTPITPPPTTILTSIPVNTDVPPATPVITVSTPQFIESENSSGGLNFVWQLPSTPIEQGDSFDVTLTVTGSQLAAPNISISLPTGLSLEQYESNNEFLATDLRGQVIVWHPVVGQQFVSYGTPATFILQLNAAVEIPSGDYTFNITTLSGGQSSFTIPIGSDTSLEEPEPEAEPILQYTVNNVPEIVNPGDSFTVELTLASTREEIIKPEIVFIPLPGLEIQQATSDNRASPLVWSDDGSMTWRPVIDQNLAANTYPATIELTLMVSEDISRSPSLLITNNGETMTVVPINVVGVDAPLSATIYGTGTTTLSLAYWFIAASLSVLTLVARRKKYRI